jgi:hypothetical protein
VRQLMAAATGSGRGDQDVAALADLYLKSIRKP